MQIPAVPVKVFILLHLVFTSWALAVDWLPFSYLFCHLIMLTLGIWVVIQPSSHDANQMFLISVLFALLNDCVLIGIYFNPDLNKRSSDLRFAVAFAFFNLFLKPITMVFIIVGYQEHGGGFDYSRVTQAFTSSSATAFIPTTAASAVAYAICDQIKIADTNFIVVDRSKLSRNTKTYLNLDQVKHRHLIKCREPCLT